MPTTKVLPCGSLEAMPSEIGRHMDHSCGSTENVVLSPSVVWTLLTDFYLRSGFWKECTQARFFRPNLL